MRTTAAVVVSCWFAFAAPAFAQTQITTGVIQGTVTDATGATLPGVTVEARNAETNLSRTLTTGSDGRFVFLQLPSGTYSVIYTLAGFATLVQENHSVDGRPGGDAVRPDDGLDPVRDGEGDGGGSRRRDDARGGGEHAQSDDRRADADPRAQVRGSPHADTWRQRGAGSRRRRDHVCRPARRVQQHQPGRRRLQQRLLRRTGRRPARRDRHHARSGQGVPGDRQRRAGGVWPHGRRRGERHHEVGHQRPPRQPLPLPAPGGAHGRPVRRHDSSRSFTASSSAARSAGRSGGTRRSISWRPKASPAISSVPI